MSSDVFLADDVDTAAAGAALARALLKSKALDERALIVFLHGDLGAGKSTLVRGLLRALGVSGVMPSPTYSLVEQYRTDNVTVFHLDAYRLSDAVELDYLGIDDSLGRRTIVLIEWPEHVASAWPDPDCEVWLSYPDSGSGRMFRVAASGALAVALAGFSIPSKRAGSERAAT